MADANIQRSKEQLLSTQTSLAGRSRPTSVYSMASIDTLVAHGGNEPGSYRGFRSKEAYLKALNEFAESKMYLENEYQIEGFYGHKTMDHYKNRPGLREHKAGRKSSVGAGQSSRRATLAMNSSASVSEERAAPTSAKTSPQDSEVQKESRVRRLSKAFTGGRRATHV